MTEKQIIKAWEDAKKYEFVPNERFIDETLEFIRYKNAEIKNLSTENKQLQSDVLIANQNYEHIKEIWEADKIQLSEKIKEYIDKHNELITKEAAIRAEAVKEVFERLKEKAEGVGIDSEGDFLYTELDEFKIHNSVADVIEHLSKFILKEMVGD